MGPCLWLWSLSSPIIGVCPLAAAPGPAFRASWSPGVRRLCGPNLAGLLQDGLSFSTSPAHPGEFYNRSLMSIKQIVGVPMKTALSTWINLG